MPKGERTVFTLVVFDKRFFYFMSNGFINFPGAYLENEYEFYISETYISREKDFVPINIDHRRNIEEYIR